MAALFSSGANPELVAHLEPGVGRRFRHPTLPLIQCLPLTQTRAPPNAPGASCQLAPYPLDATAAGWLPTPWLPGTGRSPTALNRTIGVAGGA